jgi:hypothetical protein
MKFTTLETDCISRTTLILKKVPTQYIDGLLACFETDKGDVNLDFVKQEIQLIDFESSDIKYLALCGLSIMHSMKIIEMTKRK